MENSEKKGREERDRRERKKRNDLDSVGIITNIRVGWPMKFTLLVIMFKSLFPP